LLEFRGRIESGIGLIDVTGNPGPDEPEQRSETWTVLHHKETTQRLGGTNKTWRWWDEPDRTELARLILTRTLGAKVAKRYQHRFCFAIIDRLGKERPWTITEAIVLTWVEQQYEAAMGHHDERFQLRGVIG